MSFPMFFPHVVQDPGKIRCQASIVEPVNLFLGRGRQGLPSLEHIGHHLPNLIRIVSAGQAKPVPLDEIGGRPFPTNQEQRASRRKVLIDLPGNLKRGIRLNHEQGIGLAHLSEAFLIRHRRLAREQSDFFQPLREVFASRLRHLPCPNEPQAEPFTGETPFPMKISEAIATRSSRNRFQNSRPGDWTGAVKSDSISSAEAPTGASFSSRNWLASKLPHLGRVQQPPGPRGVAALPIRWSQ